MIVAPASSPPSRAAARMRRDRRWLPLFLLLAAVVYAPFLNDDVSQGNVGSDLGAIESLVERHTFFIENSSFRDTVDKFKNDEGHLFSQKSPVFHLAFAPVYFALHRMGFTLGQNDIFCMKTLAFFTSVLPMGWLLWLLWSHPWMARRPPGERAAWTAAFAWGSLLTPFAVTLNHYTLASAALLGAWRLLCLPREDDKNENRRALWIGFYISLSLAADVPPAFMFGVAVGIYYLVRAPRQIPFLVAGAAPLALLYAALNISILGSPLPPNMHEGKMLYYEGSFWSEVRAKAEAGHPGYYQASYPRRIYHALLGHKGIYWMMPLLPLATFWAFFAAQRRRRARPALLWAAAFPVLCALLTLYWAFDLSGGSYGLRHVFATVAPLYCVLAFPLARRRRWVWRGLAPALACFGIAIAAIGVMRPWSHNIYSAWPPADNLAWWAMQKPESRPTGWIEALIEKTALDPANAWLDLGLNWQTREKWRTAAACLTRAVRIDPDLIEAWYPLGICLNEMGRSWDAWQSYAPLLARQPNNVGALNNRAIFAMRLNRPDLARQSYGQSLKAAPDNDSALYGMVALAMAEGRMRADNPYLLRGLKAHPEDPRFKDVAEQLKNARKPAPAAKR